MGSTRVTPTITLALLNTIAIGSSSCGGHAESGTIRERLAVQAVAATRTAGTAVADTETGRLRRLWAGSVLNVSHYSPSPDGRYVSETDWTTGDLAVLDLTDGSVHHLTDAGGWTNSTGFAMSSTFSTHGDQVAFVWWNQQRQRFELRTVRFDVDASGRPRGSHIRVVSLNSFTEPFVLFGWGVDGWILSLVRRPDRTNALAMISAEDGTIRPLESFDWRTPHAVRSPDGQTIAYDFPADADSPDRDIYLLSVDGTRKTKTVHEPADDVVLGWLPDGSGLLFASRQRGRSAVYRLPITGGTPAERADLIRTDVPGRVVPLGMVGSALYVGLSVESPELEVARFDLKHGILSKAERFRDPYGGATGAYDWAPDGTHLAHAAQGSFGSGDFRLVVRSLDGTQLTNFQLEGRVEHVRWAPDGRTIYLYAWDRTNLPGLRALDLESGDLRTIKRFDASWRAMGGDFAVSPDGTQLYYRELDGAPTVTPGHGSIMRMDLPSGDAHVLRKVVWRGSLAVSPDGRQLAFFDRTADGRATTLNVVPVEGGEPREVLRQPRGMVTKAVNWTPDGDTLVFLAIPQVVPQTRNHDVRLLKVPASGGEPTPLAAVPNLGSNEPRLAPDGRNIVYRAGRSRAEIWALDRLMPAGSRGAENAEGSR